MIDQNILYSACPCGSGKKFKFCCFATVRDDLPPDPTRAEVTEAIRRRSAAKRMREYKDVKVVDFDDFHRLIDQGVQRLDAGDFSGAERFFIEAREKYGMLPTPYNNLVLSALLQGDLAKAEEWSRDLIRRFPGENPFGHALSADIHYLKGDLVGALEVLAKAETFESPSADQTVRVCESMAHFMDHARIVRYVEKSGFVDAPDVAFYHGIALANLGRTVEAMSALRIAVRGKMFEQAERVLDRLLAGDGPGTVCGDWMYFTPESFTLLAGLMARVKNGDSQSMGLSAEVTAEFAEVAVNAGQLDEMSAIEMLVPLPCKRAERLLDALRRDDARSAAVRKAAEKSYGRTYAKNGLGRKMREVAEENLQQLVVTEAAATHAPLDPAYEESYLKAVRICVNPKSGKSDLEEALRILEDLHAKVPDDPAVTNNYAHALECCGRIEDSVALVEECFAQHPEYVFGAANYLRCLIKGGRMDEAASMMATYRLPQRIHPDAYIGWMKVELEYCELIGDKERARNVKRGLALIRKQFSR